MAYDPDYGWFLPSETRCKCGCGMDITDDLRHELNALREVYGAPLYLNSGARCSEYNIKVGGVTGSYHTKGMAADIRWPRISYDKRRLLTCIIGPHTVSHFGGLGIYENFVHVDIRDPKRSTLWINP